MIDLAQAIEDPNLLGSFFATESFAPLRTVAKCLSGRPITDYSEDELALVKTCTNQLPPTEPPKEFYCIAGRRSGKSLLGSACVVHRACLVDYSKVLTRGEKAVCMLVAPDRRQAGVAFSYIRSMITDTPLLAPLVVGETKETLTLSNQVGIEVHTASFRRLRGYTVACAVLDELAFFRSDDSSDPDTEIVNALRPSMSTVPTSLLLGISSPYSRRGVLYTAWERSPLMGAPDAA